jgi:hypothetical protein
VPRTLFGVTPFAAGDASLFRTTKPHLEQRKENKINRATAMEMVTVIATAAVMVMVAVMVIVIGLGQGLVMAMITPRLGT